MIVKEGILPQETVGESIETSRGVRTRKRGRVRVFRNWCKGCGLCIAFCPRQVYVADADHQPTVAHPERCVACKWCAIHCPDFAIVVEEIDPNRSEAAK